MLSKASRFSCWEQSVDWVELHNGLDVRRRETNVKGDDVTREAVTPANTANAWEFQSINVRPPLVVRLSVEFR